LAGAPAERSRLSDAEKLDWIRLIRTEAIGPITFHELIGVFGDAKAALEAIPELSRRGGTRNACQIYPLELAEREWEAADKLGAQILAFTETDYPPLLKHIAAPPPLLYAKGYPEIASRKTVGMVGSRNASAAGLQITSEIARGLGSAGAVVISGLARGIDTAAHEAALPTGTIGVIAGGIDIVYPPENTALHDAIAERGLLLTECPPGFAPRGQDFPRRNRIVSGLSSGVVIIEAARKSGSLITARLALEQGREVFAVPGHPLDPRANGTNGLIKGGACLVTCAEDVLVELFGSYGSPCYRQSAYQKADGWSPGQTDLFRESGNGERARILNSLSYTPIHPDVLLSQTGVSARELSVALLELDLAGRIERHRDQRISLKPAQRHSD
jgi:DNA processing protein